ncbi:MAG: hypothetical protein ACFFCX_00685 [Candidatus Sifarchaeia archaeon]
MYRLADVLHSKTNAKFLAKSLEDNCAVIIISIEDGRWGVYWRPKTGTLCPYGVV